MVEYDRKNEKVVVAGPRPRSPMREIPIDEEQGAEDTLDIEGESVSFPLFGEQFLRGLGKD